MSGIDEQYSDVCQKCHKVPEYWTLGDEHTGGLIWVYTKADGGSHSRRDVALAQFGGIKRVADAESRIDYVCCTSCFHIFRDDLFIKVMIRKAKDLERKGRVVL